MTIKGPPYSGTGGAERDTAASLVENSTPFGAFKTAAQYVQFAIDPSKGLNRRRYGWYSNNTRFDSSLFTSDDSAGAIRLDTTVTGTDTARLRSALAGQYISQSVAQPGVGLSLADGNVTVDADGYVSLSHGTVGVGAGWHDGSSGGWGVGGPVQTFLGLTFDSDGASAVLVGDGTHLDGSPVAQSDWNLDPMDGTGPSGRTLHPEHGYIYNFPYTWYAFGALYVGVIDPEGDEPILFHKFNVDGTSLDRPNLAPMVVVDNGGTASTLGATVGGMQFALYGARLSEEGGEERALESSRVTSGSFIADSVGTTNEAIDPNAQVGKPLIAVRREAGVRDLTIRMDELVPEAPNDIYLYAWDEYDDATALDGAWREPNEPRHSAETLVEVNTTCTTYTPTEAVARGWDKATTDKKNEDALTQLSTDDRIPIDATRVYTAVHDGSATDAELRARVVEGF